MALGTKTLLSTQEIEVVGTAASLADVVTKSELLANADVAVVDLDLGATEGSGVEVIEYIRREFPDLPVAILTNHSNPSSSVPVTAPWICALLKDSFPRGIPLTRSLMQ